MQIDLEMLIRTFQADMKVTTLYCQDDKFGIHFWLEKDGIQYIYKFLAN